FIGQDQILDTLSPTADGLFYYADHHCGRPPSRDPDNRREREAYERCVDTLSETPEFISFFEEGSALWASIAREIRGDFTQPFPASSEIARRLFDLKMGISGVHEATNAFLTGPKGSLSAQIRFSQRALDQLMAPDAPARFRANAEAILKLMQLNRDHELERKQRNMVRYIERQRSDIDPMIAAYERLVENYQRYHQISELRFLETQRIDLHAHLLQVPLNAPKESSIASVAEFQGELIEILFNALQSSLGRVGEPDGFIVGYGLLSLVQPNDVELLVSYRFDPEDDAYAPWETQLYSRGDAPLIDAGRFDLDRLLHGE
ncbi:MAG: hypothetical protein VYD19_10875, partial [Myxococcota bacterium]|nr:hypothetical protein [Myxococcota bacterium]